jgi:hypothetical protein
VIMPALQETNVVPRARRGDSSISMKQRLRERVHYDGFIGTALLADTAGTVTTLGALFKPLTCYDPSVLNGAAVGGNGR